MWELWLVYRKPIEGRVQGNLRKLSENSQKSSRC